MRERDIAWNGYIDFPVEQREFSLSLQHNCAPIWTFCTLLKVRTRVKISSMHTSLQMDSLQMLVKNRKYYRNSLTADFGHHILAIRNSYCSIDQSHYSPNESSEIQSFGTNVSLSPKYVWNAIYVKY